MAFLSSYLFKCNANHKRSKLTSREKANDYSVQASRVVWLGVKLQEEPLLKDD